MDNFSLQCIRLALCLLLFPTSTKSAWWHSGNSGNSDESTSHVDKFGPATYGGGLYQVQQNYASNSDMMVSYLGCVQAPIQIDETEECQEQSSDNGDQGLWVQMMNCYAPQLAFNLYDSGKCHSSDLISSFITTGNLIEFLGSNLFENELSLLMARANYFYIGADDDHYYDNNVDNNEEDNNNKEKRARRANERDDDGDGDGNHITCVAAMNGVNSLGGYYDGLYCDNGNFVIGSFSDASCQVYEGTLDTMSDFNQALKKHTCDSCLDGSSDTGDTCGSALQASTTCSSADSSICEQSWFEITYGATNSASNNSSFEEFTKMIWALALAALFFLVFFASYSDVKLRMCFKYINNWRPLRRSGGTESKRSSGGERKKGRRNRSGSSRRSSRDRQPSGLVQSGVQQSGGTFLL